MTKQKKLVIVILIILAIIAVVILKNTVFFKQDKALTAPNKLNYQGQNFHETTLELS